ncbi:lipopolysaccharide regulatory protein [Oxobacter pfennigii]|uniref:Lipopolysaccharide regulatory protein n=1 Tax=Oxobacter pfennigii TaxID=36849 RepID=A0A0P8YWS9_9CLOT|nr:CDC27 family protein [Oxobacter pfennigii]KPU44179.1 lipopolysaccharide regulatory protein [Oxobacter pfennigii]
MKKNICISCQNKRGRRQCVKYRNNFICGDCCSSMQLNSSCPESCIHYGKLNSRDVKNKITDLLSIAEDIKNKNANEALKIMDKALKFDENNVDCYLEKGILLESQGKYEEAIKCLKRAGEITQSRDDIIYEIVRIYKKANKFYDAIEVLSGIKDTLKGSEKDYLLGECYFNEGDFEKASLHLQRVKSNPDVPKDKINNARIMLSKIYISQKMSEKAMENALSIDDEYKEEKVKLVGKIYLSSNRFYELLESINSTKELSMWEKYMLLQCHLAINKNHEAYGLKIVDDLLNSNFCIENGDEEIALLALKVKLSFINLKMNAAYETFEKHESSILKQSEENSDCFDASILMAYFLYTIDKRKAMDIYEKVMDMELGSFIIDELYNAFETLVITPYVKAKALVKSLEIVKSGKNLSFNRTAIVADVLYEMGEYSQAYDFYKICNDAEKPDSKILYKMSCCLLKQNKYHEALKTFTDILSLTKFIPGVYAGIIKCCLENDMEWDEYFNCLELEKLSFSEVYDLAQTYMEKEYYDKSGYLYNHILDKYKNMDVYSRKMVYHNLVCVYRHLKNIDKAMEIINEIPEKYKGELIKIDEACLYYDGEGHETAEVILSDFEEHSDNPEVYFNLALIKIRLGKFNEANSYFCKAIEKLTEDKNGKRINDYSEYCDMLIKFYANLSLCYLMQDQGEDALITIEKAMEIEKNQRVMDITFIAQQKLLGKEIKPVDELIHLFDGCLAIKDGFTKDIKKLLKGILYKAYPKENTTWSKNETTSNVEAFIRNERRIYNKNKASIERSEGTVQRYIDNLMLSFEKRIVNKTWEETAAAALGIKKSAAAIEYADTLMELGDKLLGDFEYINPREYLYTALIPYFKALKILAVGLINPYYIKNLNNMPVPNDIQSYKNLGIYCYKTSGETYYRIDFSFNIMSSEYLFELNCHPGLRNKFLNFKKHYMPWDKLMWVISGIKKKWNVVDDIKSAGLLLLFYSGFENYLGIEGSFKNGDEIIALAGNLIHLGNERDYCIKNMIKGAYEFDYSLYARNVRHLAQKCREGLLKLNRIE